MRVKMWISPLSEEGRQVYLPPFLPAGRRAVRQNDPAGGLGESAAHGEKAVGHRKRHLQPHQQRGGPFPLSSSRAYSAWTGRAGTGTEGFSCCRSPQILFIHWGGIGGKRSGPGLPSQPAGGGGAGLPAADYGSTGSGGVLQPVGECAAACEEGVAPGDRGRYGTGTESAGLLRRRGGRRHWEGRRMGIPC